jgi:glycine/D-amino acid oxidase-like deaminating enzyme
VPKPLTRSPQPAQQRAAGPAADGFRVLDAVIFGGSASGLWILRQLAAAGRSALLIETDRLGAGQTSACQGIIHGGLKYTLNGQLSASARAIRSMPAVWRACIDGVRAPALGRGVLRADHCHLWHSGRALGHLGMIGARRGLRVAPVPLTPEERPQVLDAVPGLVCRLDEQVVSPRRLVGALAAPVQNLLLRAAPDAVGVEHLADGGLMLVLDPARTEATGARPLLLRPRAVILAAGIGNAALRAKLGLNRPLMQVRSVQMLLARGDLPELNAHCVEGASALVTITSDRDSAGRTIWQIGGGLSEDGVDLAADALVRHGRQVVGAALGGRALSGTEWSAYRADKAEVTTPGGQRPDDAFALREGRIITAWPTKLALVPRLAERVLALAAPLFGDRPAAPVDCRALGWPLPALAPPPWEGSLQWTAAD